MSEATTDITIAKDDQGFTECQESAKEGGAIANLTKTALEKKTGKSIVSKNNFLDLDKKKRLNNK